MHLTNESKTVPTGAWAITYAEAGLAVFPCRPRGKEPLTRHGYLDASVDLKLITSWWRRRPDANIGLALPPWLVVVDLDAPDAFERLHAADLVLPATLTCRTARGQHHYYRVLAPVTSRCCAGPVPGVDLKGAGGYVVVPPSVHPTDVVYTWVGGRFDLDLVADAPGWLVGLLGGRSHAKTTIPVSGWRELVGGVEEGQRNVAATRLAGHLLRHYVDPIVALELLRCWNAVRCSPPLPDEEVVRVVDSVAGLELRRRGGDT